MSQYSNGIVVEVLNKIMVFEGVTIEQMIEGKTAYDKGALIQHAYPFLTAAQREFLITGMTPEDWDAMCKFEEEEGL